MSYPIPSSPASAVPLSYPARLARKVLAGLSLGLMLGLALCGNSHAERLKNLVSVQGMRDNPLVGYGLVVGLDNTGDQTMQTPFTTQTLTNMLSQLGITLPAGSNMQLKNVAAVMVTATLPPFAQSGSQIDVVVSSMGNAKSLRGGTLLMTPLKGSTARSMPSPRATCWWAARALRPTAAACRSTSSRSAASPTAPSSSAPCPPSSRRVA